MTEFTIPVNKDTKALAEVLANRYGIDETQLVTLAFHNLVNEEIRKSCEADCENM